jgi:hypothetical protein
VPPIVLGSLLLAGLLVLAAALGRRLLRWLGVSNTDPLEHGVIAAGLGLGMLQFLPFAMFALGVGRPIAMRIALALLAAALLPESVAVLGAAWRWARAPRELTWWQHITFTIFALLLAAVFLAAVCPSTDDGLIYHLTAAVRYLRAGCFVYLPTLTYTNWPLGIEMLFALFLAVHPSAPVGLVQFAAGILILLTVHVYARRTGGPFVGTVAICLLLAVPIFWSEMTYVYVDLGTSLFATLAVYTFAHAQGSAAWRTLSALFAGLAATTKLSAVPVIAILPMLIVLDGPASLAKLGAAIRHGLTAFSVLIPWIGRTWALTGNPFYPLFHGLLGGREWTADGWAHFRMAHLLYNSAPGLPPTATVLRATHALLVTVFLGVAVLVAFATRRSSIASPARFAALFAAGVCLASYYHSRYLLGAFPSMAVCLALWFRGRERSLAPIVCSCAAALALCLGWRNLEPDLSTAISVASGRSSREAYLDRRLADYPVVDFANKHLPRDARVLVSMLDARTAYYESDALIANYWLQDSIHYDSDARLETDLRRLGISHLVLTPAFPAWCDESHFNRPRKQIEAASLVSLARRRGIALFEANGVVLYALHLGAERAVTDREGP